MTKPTLTAVNDNSPNTTEYIENMSSSYRVNFLRFGESYTLETESVEKLKEYSDKFTFVVLFADWCGDARRAVPVLSLLEEKAGLNVRALGGMTKPMVRSEKNWAVPPSPIEVDIFEIKSSPTIIVFDKETGEEIGRMKTKPRMTSTVEEELVKIIEDSL